MVKIGVITHYKKIEATYSHLAKQMDCELEFAVGVMKYAIKIAQEMEQKRNICAIIASAATAKVIQNHVSIPVVPLHIKNDNIFDAMHNARKIGTKIAFADINKDVMYNIEKVATILQYDVVCYPFDELSQTQAIVTRAIQEGRDVIVTPASCMHRCAEKNNLHAELILQTEQDLRDAVEHTKNLLKIKEQQAEQSKWLTAVINNTTEGVITVDKNKKVTLANTMALRILKLTTADVLEKNIKTLQAKNPFLKQILNTEEDFLVVKEQEKQYVVSRQRVKSDFGYLGSVIRLNEFENIASTEMRARKCVSATGFTAKSNFDDIKGTSDTLLETKRKALRYAQSDANILILGESGSGKEIFAQSIHNASRCSSGEFVAVNCTTLPENLLDSELFGYEDGAFTGAKKGGKAGLFELAHGGTLFMDEIGDMPLHLQVKLLRVLQEKVVRRIGGSKNIPVNVRLIFATNKDLYEDVLNKKFREDLYYRINVLELKLSPLRERKEDIPIIARHFIAQKGELASLVPEFTPEQERILQNNPWLGNARELSNFVDRLVALISQNYYDENLVNDMLSDLSQNKRGLPKPLAVESNSLMVPIGTLREIEKSVIVQLFDRYEGEKKQVEKVLGLSSTTLWRRLKEIS